MNWRQSQCGIALCTLVDGEQKQVMNSSEVQQSYDVIPQAHCSRSIYTCMWPVYNKSISVATRHEDKGKMYATRPLPPDIMMSVDDLQHHRLRLPTTHNSS